MRDGVFALVRRGCSCPDCSEDRWELRTDCYVCDGCYKTSGTSYSSRDEVLQVLALHEARGEVLNLSMEKMWAHGQ